MVARVAPLALCLGVGALISVLSGQDANWDLRNYHLYNPYALLEGRLALDLLPAGMQSTFNPALDLPYYWLATGPLATWPRMLAALNGLPFGALLFAVFRLAGWMMGALRGPERALPWLAAAMAGSAAATASEIGTTFNDIPVAALLVGAFVLAVGSSHDQAGGLETTRPRAGRPGPARPAIWFGAGAMLGAGVAFKPVIAVFVPGVVLGLFVLWPGWRGRVRPAAALVAGAAVAFAVIAGPWMAVLFRLYGSPLFPLMNGVLRSAWYPPIDLMDTRFLPRTVLQALFYPFDWIARNAMVVTEPPFRDARLAMAMLALPVLGLAAWRGWLAQPRRVLAVVAVAVTGYVLWLRLFSILRYALVLEALAAVLIVAALRCAGVALCRRWPAAGGTMGAGLAAAALGIMLWHTEPPDWWRVPYGRRVFEMEPVRLPPDSLVLAVEGPVALVLPFLDAPGYRAIGLTSHTLQARGFRLFDEMDRRIRAHGGPIYVLTSEMARARVVLPIFGVTVREDACRLVRINIVANASITLCPVEK